MAYIDRLQASTTFDLSLFRPWRVGPDILGWVREDVARLLLAARGAFREDGDSLVLDPGLTDPQSRSEAVSADIEHLIAVGFVAGRRGELYPVLRRWGEPALFEIDRGAAVTFGIKAFGCHVNGLVRTAGGVELWVATRAADRAIAPGKLDHLVAGGQPARLTLQENLVKESAEEAGIARALALTARPAGAISYTMTFETGLRRDVAFVYDLWLHDEFVPRNVDGEVARFDRWPLDRVAARVHDTDDFKFNVASVIVDLLIRRGLIGPENPDYVELVQRLRSPVDFTADRNVRA
jgi:8-oxo-dGTP pyrophosphatase MutT (NUDIX family)